MSKGIQEDSNFLNLRAISLNKVRAEVDDFLIDGEELCNAFASIRDQVIFTDKRIISINVQGVTGKKISYFSYPYSKIQYYGVETAGLMDIDSELIIYFANGDTVQFDFVADVDVRQLCFLISNGAL